MFVLGALLCGFAAHASITPTALTGRVVVNDAPAAGVTVAISSPALQQPRTTITNRDGRYWFEALPPGRYEVAFSRSGLSSLARPVVVELGRVARADARLEESEDEESVTSTATGVTVAETTAITTHFSDAELDRLPLLGERVSALALVPRTYAGVLLVDDSPFSGFLGYEGIEQLTAFRGGHPVELGPAAFDIVTARTRSGGEALTLMLRDTFVSLRGRSGHLLESESGGRIVRDRLWFFGRGWGGDPAGDQRFTGLQFKLDGQLAPAHHLVANHLRSKASARGFDSSQSVTSLRYTGLFGKRVTTEVVARQHEVDASRFGDHEQKSADARVSYVAGSHVVSAGAEFREHGSTGFYVADRWSSGRFTVNAGLRRDGGDVQPQLAATYDLLGDGPRAVVAAFGEGPSFASFGQERARARTMTLGYATAIGATGYARVDYIHRKLGGTDDGGLQAEARYRLFDRFEAGGSYSWSDQRTAPGAQGSDHFANVWAGAQFPVGSHDLGVTLLERYAFDGWSTDAALRYGVPFQRFGFTLGVDVTNAFGQQTFMIPRTWRFWARVRV